MIFKLAGILGLICIILGVIYKKKQDHFYLPGGILLAVYSIYIGDLIFIILQLVFIIAVIYDLFFRKKQEEKKETKNKAKKANGKRKR